ncbi:nicotinamide riboside kinase 1-like [Penaeus indicus]|uniref:nicotinamide riboside kinase 1-like n=1 Tax=Penaeus indicus TaxID=29960 RepID=UPI00300CBC42
MASKHWLVVGISGVTCAGKTTLAKRLLASLPTLAVYLGQDEYIYSDEFPGHLLAPPALGGLNRDSLRSIDMDRMVEDIHVILSTTSSRPGSSSGVSVPREWERVNAAALAVGKRPAPSLRERSAYMPVLLLDGYLLFNHAEIPPLCDLLYFITLPKDECWKRRKKRVYASQCQDVKLYFELCVWPKYKEHFQQMIESVSNICFKNGCTDPDTLYLSVFQDIMQELEINKQYRSFHH